MLTPPDAVSQLLLAGPLLALYLLALLVARIFRLGRPAEPDTHPGP